MLFHIFTVFTENPCFCEDIKFLTSYFSIKFTNGIFPFVIGGIQKHSYYLIKYLAKINVHVDAYHFKNSESELDHMFSKEELLYINLIEFSFPKSIKFPGHYIFNNYILSKEYYKVAIKTDYDFIYCQGFTAWYFLKKHPFKKNIISNLHGLEMFQTSVNFRNKLEKFLLKIPAKNIIRNSYRQISLGGKLTSLLYDNGAIKESAGLYILFFVEMWERFSYIGLLNM